MGHLTTLHVSGFNQNTRARDLAYTFERFGRLVRCDIPAPRPNSTRLFAFVEFENHVEADDAYRTAHNMKLETGTLKIEWARNSPSARWRFDGHPDSQGSRSSRYSDDRRRDDDRRGRFYDDDDRRRRDYGDRDSRYRRESRDRRYDSRDVRSTRSRRSRSAEDRRSTSPDATGKDRTRSPARHRSRSPAWADRREDRYEARGGSRRADRHSENGPDDAGRHGPASAHGSPRSPQPADQARDESRPAERADDGAARAASPANEHGLDVTE